MIEQIVFSPEALADFSAAVSFVATRSPSAAKRLSDSIFSILDRLAAREFEGPEQRLRTGEIVHSWPVASFRVYYQRTATSLEVLRIYHHAREPIAD